MTLALPERPITRSNKTVYEPSNAGLGRTGAYRRLASAERKSATGQSFRRDLSHVSRMFDSAPAIRDTLDSRSSCAIDAKVRARLSASYPFASRSEQHLRGTLGRVRYAVRRAVEGAGWRST